MRYELIKDDLRLTFDTQYELFEYIRPGRHWSIVMYIWEDGEVFICNGPYDFSIDIKVKIINE